MAAVDRYMNARRVSNRSKYYAPLRKNRVPPYPLGNLVQYATVRINHPSAAEKNTIMTTEHTWSYGDRYYNLAAQYYGNAEYWWVIAMFNNMPTESHCKPGVVLQIPIKLSSALSILGY